MQRSLNAQWTGHGTQKRLSGMHLIPTWMIAVSITNVFPILFLDNNL